jgi:hypothetical protein
MLGLLTLAARMMFADMPWQDVLALFLDPGCFAGKGEHDWFRIIAALIGVFTFSALLVSVFSNIISNISDSWLDGDVRFRHKGHILILGGHDHLLRMLKDVETDLPDGEIVIMTTSDVRNLRNRIAQAGLPDGIDRRITIYSGNRSSKEDLQSVSPQKARMIYIIGENGESDHDARCLACVRTLRNICDGGISVFVMMTSATTTGIMARTVTANDSRLHIDYVNLHDYEAEQLLVGTSFMPILKAGCKKNLDFYIIGLSDMSRAVAETVAHIAHFPNFATAGRSRINIVGEGATSWAHKLIAADQGLFRLSRWQIITESTATDEGRTVSAHVPDVADGDYLDIEWRFLDCSAESEMFRKLCKIMSGETRFVVCHEDDEQSLATAFNLPADVRSIPIAIYAKGSTECISAAISTAITYPFVIFGNSSENNDSLFLHRALLGKRVNYLYDCAYNSTYTSNDNIKNSTGTGKSTRGKNADWMSHGQRVEEAWNRIPEAHKLSSIYSAMALPLRKKCIDESTTTEELCEMEHRRWMMSCLLMGYMPLTLEESEKVRNDKALFKSLKSKYTHADITPFSSLDEFEKGKDLLMVKHMSDILKD